MTNNKISSGSITFPNLFGSEAEEIIKLLKHDPALAKQLNKDYPYTYAEVVWIVRNEIAMIVEDVLARRMRI